MVFIFWLNWDLIENNYSFPLSFHPHPPKKNNFWYFNMKKKQVYITVFIFFLDKILNREHTQF